MTASLQLLGVSSGKLKPSKAPNVALLGHIGYEKALGFVEDFRKGNVNRTINSFQLIW